MAFQRIEKFDPRKITLGKVEEKYVKFYSKSANGDLDKITFQVPMMKIVFDVEEKKTRDGKVFVKNVSLSTTEVGSDNNKKRIEILKEKIISTEERIRKLLPSNLQDKSFTSSLWQGKNTDYSPTFKASIPFRDGECGSGVFDQDNNPIDDSTLTRGQYVSMAITLDKLWVWNDKIGLNWEINQIKVHEEPKVFPRESKRIMIKKD